MRFTLGVIVYNTETFKSTQEYNYHIEEVTKELHRLDDILLNADRVNGRTKIRDATKLKAYITRVKGLLTNERDTMASTLPTARSKVAKEFKRVAWERLPAEQYQVLLEETYYNLGITKGTDDVN